MYREKKVPPKQQDIRRRTCATMDEHRRLAYLYPEYRRRRREIELERREFIARYADEGLRTGVVRIPVVVHVVWNTAAQNISDAQIQSQIDVLNADFRRTNADIGSVPAPFAGFTADTRIEFALAVRDPNCGSTNGITRTNTATPGFFYATRNNVKSVATGGADPWPSERYLNLWVAHFADNVLGFAAFPGEPPALDGVVIATDAFGTIGTAAAPFNLGRTGTHEVGHWLDLVHIWGDDKAAAPCIGSDECADTPNQADENVGMPPFPQISCGNGPNGDMFMNYMDYTNDAGMFMFTQDQAIRMNATLSVARTGLLASDGLVPVDAPAVADLWMQDNADDTGVEPDPSTNPMYISDDIWVRNAPDGLANQDHQNPLGEQLNYVYVRVRNRGCSSVAGTQAGTLKLYWAKASTSLPWPAPWDGSVTSPALLGGFIGSQPVSVAGGAQQIVEFDWTPPDPSDYASFGADKAHFCLLARIETSPAAPFGMTTPETGNLYANVQNNNNIVWKNISIVDTDGDGARFADVIVGNFKRDQGRLHLIFDTPRQLGASLFDWGYILVEFRGDALIEWARGNVDGEGFERLADGRLIIMQSGARLTGPPLKPGEFGTLHVQFVPDGRRATGAQVFVLDVTELDQEGQRRGGQRFLLKTTAGRKRPNWDNQLGTFDGVTWKPKGYGGCGCGC